ncbi:MAG: hypothetical protein ACI84R_000894 [Candidatus Azotimanducaceae bacterium]
MGGLYDWSLIHPVEEDKPGCINLGDYAYQGQPKREMKAICSVADTKGLW